MKLSNGVYVLCGVPGAGKSTFVSTVEQANPDSTIFVISADQIRLEWYGDENIQGDGRAIWEFLYEVLDVLTTSRGHLEQIVIVDSTMSKQKDRRVMAEFLAERNVEPTLIYINKDLDVIKRQNSNRNRVVPEDVIERMHNNLKSNHPSKTPGYKDFIEVTE